MTSKDRYADLSHADAAMVRHAVELATGAPPMRGGAVIDVEHVTEVWPDESTVGAAVDATPDMWNIDQDTTAWWYRAEWHNPPFSRTHRLDLLVVDVTMRYGDGASTSRFVLKHVLTKHQAQAGMLLAMTGVLTPAAEWDW